METGKQSITRNGGDINFSLQRLADLFLHNQHTNMGSPQVPNEEQKLKEMKTKHNCGWHHIVEKSGLFGGSLQAKAHPLCGIRCRLSGRGYGKKWTGQRRNVWSRAA